MWCIWNEGTRTYSKSACTYGVTEQVSQSPHLAKKYRNHEGTKKQCLTVSD